eukprot:CFRG7028T1
MVINSSSKAVQSDTFGGKNSSSVSLGGYDYTYVSHVLECLCCAVCLFPARDAVETNCGHMCCSECLQVWLKNPSMEPACPVCRTELSAIDVRPSIFLQRQILNLQVRCDRKAESEDNIDSERNNSVSAARQAQMEVTSKEPSNANPKAHDMLSSAGATESSLTSCNESMTIREMLIHEGTCSFARVMCPAGCGHRVVRANIDDHLQEKAGSHIRTLYEHNKKLHEHNNELLVEMRKILDDTCLGTVGFIVSRPVKFSSLSFRTELELEMKTVPAKPVSPSPTKKGLVFSPAMTNPNQHHIFGDLASRIDSIDSNYVIPRNVQALVIPSTYGQTDCLDVFPKLFRLQKMIEMYICCRLEEEVLDIPPVPSLHVLKIDNLAWSESVLRNIGRAFPALEVLVVGRVDVDIQNRVDRGSFASLQKLEYCKLPNNLTFKFG